VTGGRARKCGRPLWSQRKGRLETVAKPGFGGPYAKLTDGPGVVSMRNMAISSKIVINMGCLQDKPFI
jgi:hypothetical protein